MGLLLLDSTTTVLPTPTDPFVSAFAGLVASMDRLAQTKLGGSPVTYTTALGVAVPVSGIFDQVYVLAKGDPMAGVEALGPAVWLLLADLPVHPDDDDPTVTIDGLVYNVTERRPDGMGGIVLALRLVQ